MGKSRSQKRAVGVVIPTWSAAAFVDRVLAKLILQEDVDYEIVVVDNGVVNRDTEAVVERYKSAFPRLRYLRFEKQLGYAGAVNAGTAAAAHELVAVMNNDNLPEPRWLAELLKVYEAEARPDSSVIVGSLIERPDFTDPLHSNINLWARIVRVAVWRRGHELFHPDGSAFLFDKTVFPVPYDEEYFVYQEDVALGWRAWLEGHRVLLAENSRGLTFDGGSTRRIKYRTAFYTERNRWLNYFYFLSLRSLFFGMLALKLDAWLKFVFGSNRRAKLHAWGWVILNLPWIWLKRIEVQSRRRRPDSEILPLLSGTYGQGKLLDGLFRALTALLPLGK